MSMMANQKKTTSFLYILFTLTCFAIALLWPAHAFCDVSRLDARLKQLEAKTQQIEALQKSAQAEQIQILEKIKELKVWAHRN